MVTQQQTQSTNKLADFIQEQLEDFKRYPGDYDTRKLAVSFIQQVSEWVKTEFWKCAQ